MAIFQPLIDWLSRIPYSIIAFIGRFALAATFWLSGQTKIEGFKVNLFDWSNNVYGIPRLSDSTVFLFENEYNLPLLDPYVAAVMATTAEFILPILLLLGLFTRFAALGILSMTLVIQFLVYPGAYALHSTWATIALMLIAMGPGAWSLDALFGKK